MSYDLFFFFQTFLSASFIAFITSVLNIGKLKLKKHTKTLLLGKPTSRKTRVLKKRCFLIESLVYRKKEFKVRIRSRKI